MIIRLCVMCGKRFAGARCPNCAPQRAVSVFSAVFGNTARKKIAYNAQQVGRNFSGDGNIIRIRRIFAAVVFAFAGGAAAAEESLQRESDYVAAVCERWRGKSEVRLSDGAGGFVFADCIYAGAAAEFDYGGKYAECVSQAVLYSALQGAPPVCVLIRRKSAAAFARYVRRAQIIAAGFRRAVAFRCIAADSSEFPCP